MTAVTMPTYDLIGRSYEQHRRRYGHLRALAEVDLGYRLVVSPRRERVAMLLVPATRRRL